MFCIGTSCPWWLINLFFSFSFEDCIFVLLVCLSLSVSFYIISKSSSVERFNLNRKLDVVEDLYEKEDANQTKPRQKKSKAR